MRWLFDGLMVQRGGCRMGWLQDGVAAELFRTSGCDSAQCELRPEGRSSAGNTEE